MTAQNSPPKLELARSVCVVINELYRLVDMGLSERRIDRVRREAIFFLYEGGEAAKWDNTRPHSAGARRLIAEIGRSKAIKQITYDHAIPLRTLWPGLKASARNPDVMLDFLERHVRGVVLLREENLRLNGVFRSSMPLGCAADDRLARYRAVGIEFDPEDLARLAH
jgi:hypothetical protein